MRLTILFGLVWSIAAAQTINVPRTLDTANVATEPNPWAQIIVDAMRDQSKADAAFLAASFFANAKLDQGSRSVDDVVKALQQPEDEVVIVTLRGEQIKAAFERSLGLVPQRNSAYLQVSGIRVEYKLKEASGSRVDAVFIDDKPLVNDKQYKVAMSGPLARGALGYFRIWDKTQISKNTEKTVEEDVRAFLAGKTSLPLDAKPRLVTKE